MRMFWLALVVTAVTLTAGTEVQAAEAAVQGDAVSSQPCPEGCPLGSLQQGQGQGARDGSGPGRGQGGGRRDGSGERRGQGHGARDGSGPGGGQGHGGGNNAPSR